MSKSALARTAAGSRPPRSAAREKLALAIAALAEATEERAALAAALEVIEREVAGGYGLVPAAENALEQAKAGQQAYRMAEALGRLEPGQMSVEQAQRNLDKVQAQRDELRERCGFMQAALAAAIQAENYRVEARDAAAVVVLGESPEVPRLVASVEQLQTQLTDQARALHWLASKGVIQDGIGVPLKGYPADDRSLGARSREALGYFDRAQHIIHVQDVEKRGGGGFDLAQWLAALDELKADADAVLPGEAR